MGVLNVTPDSFYDGGRYTSENAILQQVEKMLAEGAQFIDVGGYSSRPGADNILPAEERKRSVQAVSAIVKHFPDCIVSVDTFRSEIAEAAVGAGASIVNDISGGQLDPEMFATVSKLKVPYILMHMRGNPKTMNDRTQYTDLVKELVDYFHERIHTLRQLGVRDVIIDPGFGFSKTVSQNFTLLQHLEKFSILGKPVLAGLSRKSMIWRTLAVEPTAALNGTTALNAIALLKGAAILRVHDVKEARETIKLVTSVMATASM